MYCLVRKVGYKSVHIMPLATCIGKCLEGLYSKILTVQWLFPGCHCWFRIRHPCLAATSVLPFYLLSTSNICSYLSSNIPCPCWIMLFSFPNHCDFSGDFRKEHRLINILLNPPFVPIISLRFIEYSEELINYNIHFYWK